MDTKRILNFLKDVAANNNRPWFQEHKEEYLACKADFEEGISKAIAVISEFDPEIANLKVSDCCYRFYRDIRFSQDKSPYKRHFGAYICSHGKKALRGGYYIHIQPDQCLICTGSYWLPTNILTSCRNEIMGNIEEWRTAVENKEFIDYYGLPNDGSWVEDKPSAKGFGIEKLKTVPKGFPRDYAYINYLRMKDYACWRVVPNDFFDGDGWMNEIVKYFKVAKPMMDIVNSVVDDYE
ncbi:MAG: DUF2461 domain-containing protein [Prevotella sp.]|jgi:uncharacterized protein (TIGR02453 family)|nr:DUF2461 domain-containing protein [Prevotella sp.]MCI1281729.1 DUF2461 domain-containing protein [Prevotella sp.]